MSRPFRPSVRTERWESWPNQEQEVSVRRSLMLAALTPLLIDVLGKRSVKTREQIHDRTINQTLPPRTRLYQERGPVFVCVCVMKREGARSKCAYMIMLHVPSFACT